MESKEPIKGLADPEIAAAIHKYFESRSQLVTRTYVESLIPKVRSRVLDLCKGHHHPANDPQAVAEALNHILSPNIVAAYNLGNERPADTEEEPDDDIGNRL